ncbi:MAG: protein kinase, partial [Planctomycetes bacterium]|nr:protein kinase [Planctomycetota bacterium]
MTGADDAREELLTRLVEAALQARADGRPVDLAEICSEAPDLQPEVERLLAIEPELTAGRGRDDDAPSDPLVGKVLDGRYELEACIGIGAMGSVYRANDASLQRDVAVKLLQNGLFASAARRERFAREARVLAALRHPSIVGVHDHGCTEEGLHYLVMELIDGVPLAQVLQQAERIVTRGTGADLARLDAEWLQSRFGFAMQGLGYLPQSVFWCSQVASALAEAHRAGVAHRDVKPSNVLV